MPLPTDAAHLSDYPTEAPLTETPPRRKVYRSLLLAAGILTMAIIVQVIHDSEHIAQVFQHGIQGHSVKESSGLLGLPLNLEWVHWVYNGLFLMPLVAALWFVYRTPAGLAQLRSRWFGGAGLVYLWAAVVVQSIHFMEHQVRMFQQWGWVGSATKADISGCEPCPGTLGQNGLLLGANGFDGVYLHFVFNTVVTILPLIALIPLRPEISAGCCSVLDWILGRKHAHATA